MTCKAFIRIIFNTAAALIILSGMGTIPVYPSEIVLLKKLSYHENKAIKKLRSDIRKSVYIIKSNRPLEELPELKFYKYRIKKGDTFFKILSRTSMDIDTLKSVNNLSAPSDLVPGMTIYIPNMRGVIIKNGTKSRLSAIMRSERISKKYITSVNKSSGLNKSHIFVPCGKLTTLERSLFLGSGFMYPVKYGRRSSGFGSRRNPFHGRTWEFHKGIDISVPVKTPVYATRTGRVSFCGYTPGYGNLVIIQHEHGYKSYYGHLSAIRTRKGRFVKRGQCIALSGNTGRSTGPHIHFEIRKKGRPVNPVSLLTKRK